MVDRATARDETGNHGRHGPASQGERNVHPPRMPDGDDRVGHEAVTK
jgi:hypothetical protein